MAYSAMNVGYDLQEQIDGKADKQDTVLTTTLSKGRKANTNVGYGSFAFGNNVSATATNAHAIGSETTASGYHSHAEGEYSTASNDSAHAEGYYTVASGKKSHAEGTSTTASGENSHAEGLGTVASGVKSHAEGDGTTAGGAKSHAEGDGTSASGESSHAEGLGTVVSGVASHVEGHGTEAQGWYQHVGGTYNVPDQSSLEIIGNGGSSSAKSNARLLDTSGNERLKGDIYVGCNADSTGGTALGAGLASANAAITNINNTLIPYTATPVTDMNSITSTAGTPYTGRWTGADTSHAPLTNNQGTFYGFKSSDNYETQFAIDNSGYAYIRGKRGGTWYDWGKCILEYDPIKLTSITNFDSFVGSGGITFGTCSGDSATSAPFTGDNTTWRGYVVGSATYCTQFFVSEYSTTSYNRRRTFVRALLNGSWSSWTEIAHTFGWLDNNVDINNITVPGVYGLNGNYTYPNAPVKGTLEVFGASRDGTYAWQRMTTSNAIYWRYRSGNSGTTWGSWYKITGTVVT